MRDEHPHYMGPISYTEKEIQWRSQGCYGSAFDGDIPKIADIRLESWMKAREKVGADGNIIIPNEETLAVKQKITKWQERVEKGEFTPTNSDDVLNRALERTEHPGHALALGSHTSVKRAFGTTSRRGKLQPDKEEIEAMVEYGISIPSGMFEGGVQVGHGLKKTTKTVSQSGGNDSLIGLEKTLSCKQGKHKCRICLMIDGLIVIVPHGLADFDRTVLHNRTVPPDHVCVSIDSFVPGHGNDPLPVPTE